MRVTTVASTSMISENASAACSHFMRHLGAPGAPHAIVIAAEVARGIYTRESPVRSCVVRVNSYHRRSSTRNRTYALLIRAPVHRFEFFLRYAVGVVAVLV